jgi:ketosteroid isomerase-like protein
MDGTEFVRAYYRAIDGDDDGTLADLLAPTFRHERPDRTIDGRDAFVAFMRDGRPDRDTEHVLEAVYVESEGSKVAAEGRLLRADGAEWFRFVDVFDVGQDAIGGVRTYTDLE